MAEMEVRAFRDDDSTVPLQDWLDNLETVEPRAYEKCLALILELARRGSELRMPTSKKLRDDIFELRAKVGTVNYRILYFFTDKRGVACCSHGLTKEDVVPKGDIDLAVKRKALVKKNYNRHTADIDVED